MSTQRVSQMTVVTPQTRYKNLGGNWNTFQGGNQSADDLRAFVAGMVARPAQAVTAGGTLTINGQSLGSYDYTIKQGDQTISSFSAGDWFTTTEDTRSAIITVNGNLTINSGQTLTPSVRKLFTCIYVQGNLTVNGAISMSSRGANHNGTGNSGGAVTAAAIKLINNGTYGGVTNPEIPAAGASGGSSENNGGGGTNGGTGGGGGGSSPQNRAGAGAAGTSFTGGSAGGSSWAADGQAGTARGGAGGNSACGGSGSNGGGAGNPGGSGCGGSGQAGRTGQAGTGGVLIIYVTGTYSGSGSISASGATGGACDTTDCANAGSGSGGGSVTIFATSGTTPTPSASGGGSGSTSGCCGDRRGGRSGGAGTARVLTGAF